jgi:DNA/RNA-binding domain of Phe-tRNA-synthetase-like protein
MIIAIYPHRDAEYSKITQQTNDLVIISCGVPGIPVERLKKAVDNACNFIIKFCSEL